MAKKQDPYYWESFDDMMKRVNAEKKSKAKKKSTSASKTKKKKTK